MGRITGLKESSNRARERLKVDRFIKELADPELAGGDRIFDLAVGRYQDRFWPGGFRDFFEEGEPAAIG